MQCRSFNLSERKRHGAFSFRLFNCCAYGADCGNLGDLGDRGTDVPEIAAAQAESGSLDQLICPKNRCQEGFFFGFPQLIFPCSSCRLSAS